MVKPQISVIIPIFNVASFLDECISSLVDQTYKEWECILVDDGSTDGSDVICDQWTTKDERIHVIHQVNAGVSGARNRGIEEARGDFYVFVDSDDTLGPNHLYCLVNAPLADIVVSGIRQEKTAGLSVDYKPSGDKTFELDQEHVDAFVALNEKFLFYGPVAKLYKASIIKSHSIRFPLNCSYGEDLQFNLHYLHFVKSISQVENISYYYRRGTDTLSTRTRSDQFTQDYEQWKLLQAFYVNRGLWLQPSKELLYNRLWGIVYDGIFSTETSNQTILSIPEIKDLKKYQYVFHCSKWIKWCILHRIAFMFR